jgi:hypothetical protein
VQSQESRHSLPRLLSDVGRKIVQFPVTLTARFLKRSYAKRIFHRWWLVVIAVIAVSFATRSSILEGPFGLLPMFAFAAFGVYVVLSAVVWTRQSKALDEWLRHQAGAPVIYSLSEEAIESSAAIGSTRLKWDAFRSLTITDFDTLLAFSPHGALTLPTDQVPPEALHLLKKQFLAHGRKVDDQRKKE